jgi:sugar transferase (PEP-CTERM system associated)
MTGTVASISRAFSRYQPWRAALCFCVEFLLISGVVIVAAVLRFSPYSFLVDYGLSYIPHALLTALVCQGCMYYADLYDLRVALSGSKLFLKIVQSLAVATVVLAVLFYLMPSMELGRGVMLLSMVFIVSVISGWRLLFQWVLTMRQLCMKVLIVGTGEEARSVARELLDRRSLGYDIKGFIDDDPAKLGVSIVNPCVIGNTAQLPEIVAREQIDKIVIALPDRRGKLPLEALLTCKLRGVEVEEGTTFYERLSGRVMLQNLRPSWLIFSQGFTVLPLTRLLKRLCDILLSMAGLVIGFPLAVLIAVLIKLDSRGPIFFTQQRVGQFSQLFTLIKFRSMCVDAEAQTGPVYADQHDSRITRVGRCIRLTRLDELPQLLNVLKGEMSFVGPRPERPFFVRQFEKDILYYSQRLSVKPGITGWAQVNYQYGANAEDAVEKLQLDLYYIKNMSVVLDLFIMLKTLKIIVLSQGAR